MEFKKKFHSTLVQILLDPMYGWIPVLITPIVTFDMANSFKNGFTTSKKYPATLSHSEPGVFVSVSHYPLSITHLRLPNYQQPAANTVKNHHKVENFVILS